MSSSVTYFQTALDKNNWMTCKGVVVKVNLWREKCFFFFYHDQLKYGDQSYSENPKVLPIIPQSFLTIPVMYEVK